MLTLAFIVAAAFCLSVDAYSVEINGDLQQTIAHLNDEVAKLRHDVDGLKECHVDVHVHTDDAHAHTDGRSVDLNLHVQEAQHAEAVTEVHAAEEHEDLYGYARMLHCADSTSEMTGYLHFGQSKAEDHVDVRVLLDHGTAGEEYQIIVHHHGDLSGEGDNCGHMGETFDPEDPQHRGILGTVTADENGHIDAFLDHTHFTLRGDRFHTLYGHAVAIYDSKHAHVTHGVIGESDSNHERHFMMREHWDDQLYDFDHDDVFGHCLLHEGIHGGEPTHLKGHIHLAQHSHGDHDMEIRVEATGAQPNKDYKLVAYQHGDVGHHCSDMGTIFETTEHELEQITVHSDAHGVINQTFYHAHYTMLGQDHHHYLYGHAFALNDDEGDHEACCVVGVSTYRDEHGFFVHERDHWTAADSYARAVVAGHGNDLSDVQGEVDFMQHQTAAHAVVRVELSHFHDHDTHQLWVAQDGTIDPKCPEIGELEAGHAEHIGDFHPTENMVADYTFDVTQVSIKPGSDSVIGHAVVVIGPDGHADGCGVIAASTFEEHEHNVHDHPESETHHV